MDPDGALAVPGAQEIVGALAQLTEFAVRCRIPIIASADAHDPEDAEFKDFPPHCVAGTPGQKKIAQTSPASSQPADEGRIDEQVKALRSGELAQLVIEKQALDVFTEPAADRVLSALRPRRVVVYGVTTEYCVLRAVLGLRERGYRVTVLEDAVKAVDDDSGRKAIEQMTRAGARLDRTASVVAGCE